MNKFALLHSALVSGIRHNDVMLYAAILKLSSKHAVSASRRELADASGVPEFSVQRAIKGLVSSGLVSVDRIDGKRNTYSIHAAPTRCTSAAATRSNNASSQQVSAYKERAHARKALRASPYKSTSAGFASVDDLSEVAL